MPGDRFFPATISTDDPFVANDIAANLSVHSTTGRSATKAFDLSADVALKLTPNFGIEAREGYMLQSTWVAPSYGVRQR